MQSVVVHGSRITPAAWRAALPPLIILALAGGYLGADLFMGAPELLSIAIPTPVATAVVVAQALALAFRHRMPVAAFAIVVLLDAVLLGTSSGGLGVGAVAVMFATFTVLSGSSVGTRHVVVGFGAMITLIVGTIAMAIAKSYPLLVVVAFTALRLILQYVVPAVLAGAFHSRARLVAALRERAEFAVREREREREREVEQEITELRTAMARELHDIAAHHLSGIIVGAQAGSALITTDPERTREMLSIVQQDARTTLTDLRQAVELLRGGDRYDSRMSPESATTPTVERVTSIVQTATDRGQLVDLRVDGDPRPLGPLAEIAGYRMVQESLANAARHARGAASRVHVEYLRNVVRITVHNSAAPQAKAAASPSHNDAGYGISGMHERAGLAGGRLTTGRVPNGDWLNVLEIPSTRRGAHRDPTAHR